MIYKLIKFIFFILFVIIWDTTYGNALDTILNTVYSKPYFYNVLENNKGEVYAGTSEGIFKLDGTDLIRYNKQDGYITLNKDGLPAHNPDGIKNYMERKYLHLLPYPELAREEYHADAMDYFYICSGGRIYIYDLTPYSYSYPNHSIRTISENFVGTYSGIYLKGKLMTPPLYKFTDGYIREINGKALICYDGLTVVEPEAIRTGKIDYVTRNNYELESKSRASFRDVFKSNVNGKFYFAATTEIFQLDNLKAPFVSIYKHSTDSEGDISILGEGRNSIYFSAGKKLLGYQIYGKNFFPITSLPQPILSGKVNDRHLYVLTNSALYDINTEKTVKKLVSLSKAHTLELISDSELVIGTDNGLFRFNTVNNSLATLISGVEFNRRALFIKNNLLYAGSINGLYTININDFDLLVRKNQPVFSESKIPNYVVITLTSSVLIIVGLLFLLFKNKRNLNSAKHQIKELKLEDLDREKIEQYIRENLAVASLKSITDHFNTNNSQVYKLIEPEKPGSIIQKLRHAKVAELREQGADIREISRVTGLSESYIRKIKNLL